VIRVRTRGPEPDKLKQNKANWTARFQSDQHSDWATKTAKAFLRAELLPLTHGKCAFCECRLDRSDRTQIEHYHCKKVYKDRVFEWVNLLPACGFCNGSKGDRDHQGAQIKPDDEDPENFFSVHPDTGIIEPQAGLTASELARAEETIRLFDLNRAALTTSRKERLEELEGWIGRMILSGDPGIETWQRLSRPNSEFKLVLRSFLGLRGYTSLADEDRRFFHA